jgi:hypothetical protein
MDEGVNFTMNLLDLKKSKMPYVFVSFHCTPVYQNPAAATVEDWKSTPNSIVDFTPLAHVCSCLAVPCRPLVSRPRLSNLYGALGSGTSSLSALLHVRAFWKHEKRVTRRKAGQTAC